MTRVRPAYEDRIIADPEIMVGKPVVKGTRIPVELVLGELAKNPDLDELFAAYPRLTIDDVRVCLGYARALAAGQKVHPRPGPARRDRAAQRA
jgi:uncharacterized protein (DUF433 family)